jgi:hypothetical protein
MALTALSGDSEIDAWLGLIRAEYYESPGLQLTAAQAQRFWGIDTWICDALLAALVDSGFLRRTSTGAFVRATGR